MHKMKTDINQQKKEHILNKIVRSAKSCLPLYRIIPIIIEKDP